MRRSRRSSKPWRSMPVAIRSRPRSRAKTEVPRGRGHTTAWEARQSRAPPRVAGRVDRSHAPRGRDAHRHGKRWARAAGFGEALKGLLPAPLTGEPERDPAVEIDSLKRNVRRVALRPPRIGQVLLRRVRDGARTQEEGEPARPDDGRFQRPDGELAGWIEHALFDHAVGLQ